jgi:hypothetical protein
MNEMAGGGRTTKAVFSSSARSDDALHARKGLSHDCYTASVLSSLTDGVVDAVERFPALSFPHKTRSFALSLSFLPSYHFSRLLHSRRRLLPHPHKHTHPRATFMMLSSLSLSSITLSLSPVRAEACISTPRNALKTVSSTLNSLRPSSPASVRLSLFVFPLLLY